MSEEVHWGLVGSAAGLAWMGDTLAEAALGFED